MEQLPPEDQPHFFLVGPVGPIPIVEADDPRFVDERRAWSDARRKAQALHTADELLAGVQDGDWRVRHQSVDRLKARWHDDERTLPAILDLVRFDRRWEVRSQAAMALLDFEIVDVSAIAESALADPSAHVRWSASFVLFQGGLLGTLPNYSSGE